MVATDEAYPTDSRSAAPWWVQAVYRLGVPAAAMGVLLWFLMSNVTGQLTNLTTLLAQHIAHTENGQSEVRFYLRAICLNSAKDEAGRSQCVIGQGANGGNHP